MKSFVIALALCSSLLFVQAAPSPQSNEDREDQYLRECNATTPAQRNPQFVIASGVATGDIVKLSPAEQCVLLCFLQKLRVLNENGNIRNGSSIVKYAVTQSPELAQYSDVLIANIFQIDRSTKGFQDKCLKAQIIYHQLAQQIFALELADGLKETGIKEKIINAVEKGQSVDADVATEVKEYLQLFDALVTAFAKAASGGEQQQRIAI